MMHSMMECITAAGLLLARVLVSLISLVTPRATPPDRYTATLPQCHKRLA